MQKRTGRGVDAAVVAGGEESADEQQGLNLPAAQLAPRINVQDSHGYRWLLMKRALAYFKKV